MHLFKQRSFLVLYTVQVGVTVFGCCGLTLMAISVVVNLSFIMTSTQYAESTPQPPAEAIAQFMTFLTFIMIGCTAYCLGLRGVHQENKKLMKMASIFLSIHAICWIFLTVVYFEQSSVLVTIFCLNKVRCGDRFFIHKSHWTNNNEKPFYFFNYIPSNNSKLIFETETSCMAFCQSSATSDRTPHPSELTYRGGNGTQPPLGLPSFQTNSSNLEAVNGGMDDTILTEKPKSSCICKAVPINTLVGPMGSTAHLVFSILFTVAIAVVWYFYSICIFVSYYYYLKRLGDEKHGED